MQKQLISCGSILKCQGGAWLRNLRLEMRNPVLPGEHINTGTLGRNNQIERAMLGRRVETANTISFSFYAITTTITNTLTPPPTVVITSTNSVISNNTVAGFQCHKPLSRSLLAQLLLELSGVGFESGFRSPMMDK